MTKIYIPTNDPEQWAQFLAEPIKHWRRGYSARALAYCWQEADGFPREIHEVLTQHFSAPELLLAIPEHQVPLPGGSRPSQTDVWALGRSGDDLISIAVEGKVSEPFGPTVQEWKLDASPGKESRLAYLTELLGLPEAPDSTRYQLLHRTASAIIEAKRFHAAHAVMLVHSFSQTNEWFDDFSAFASLMGAKVSENSLVPIGDRSGIQLYLGWVKGNARYLST